MVVWSSESHASDRSTDCLTSISPSLQPHEQETYEQAKHKAQESMPSSTSGTSTSKTRRGQDL